MRRLVSLFLVVAMMLAPAQTLAQMDLGQGSTFLGPASSRASGNDTDSEPNNEISKATNLTGNVSVLGTLNTPVGDAADFYRIMLNNTTSPNRLNSSLEFTSNDPTALAYLAILDPYGFRLDQVLCMGSPVNGSALSIYQDYFYIGVMWDIQNQASATISYTLNVSLVDQVFIADGNDHPDNAIAVADGEKVSDTVDELLDPSDFYMVHLNDKVSSVDVVFLLLEMDPSVDLAIEIYNSTPTFIRQVNDVGAGNDELVYYVAPSTDDYYFRVWANTGAGSYDLSVFVGTGHLDNDNDVGNATMISDGDTVTGNLTDDYDMEDYYSVDLGLGEEITVNLTVLDHNTSLQMPVFNIWLFNESNFVKNSTSSSTGSKEVWYEAENAGTYYIRVGTSDMSFGGYELKVSVVSPPMILPHNSSFTLKEDQEGVLNLSTIFSDPQGGALVFDFSGNVTTTISINGSDAMIRSLIKDWYGSEIVTFSARNSLDKIAWINMNIIFTSVNDGPVAQGDALDLETDEDVALELTRSFVSTKFTDVDGDELNYTFLPNDNIGVLQTNESFILTPVLDWNGLAIMTLMAKDPSGLNATLQVNLTVLAMDDGPVGTDIGDINMSEDGSTVLNLSSYFFDPDSEDVLVFDGYSEGGSSGERHVFILINGTSATITLAQDWSGQERLTFTAKDPNNNTANSVAFVNAEPVNDAPTVSQTYLDIYTSQTWVVEDKSGYFDMTRLFIDVDGDKLTYTVRALGTHISVTMNGGNLVVTPSSNWFGVEDVNISAQDPLGLKISTILPVTVMNDNDGPVLSNGAVTKTSGTVDTRFEFSVVVTDIDGDDPVVFVVIDGKDLRMSKISGEIELGAMYTYSTKLKGGGHKYSFKANDNKNTALSEGVLDGGKIDVDMPVDTSGNMVYIISIILIVIVGGLIYGAYNRSQRMKEYDDSWDDDEEEDEEIPEDDE